MHTLRKFLFLTAAVSAATLRAQSTNFSVEGRPVQVHGFASQAFSISDENNYLTMPTSTGSIAFTDFGANITVQLTGNLRLGAQFYDRNIGQLGKWHPQLDWASADYRFKDWLGVRAGKIKTVLGLYNDTQDLETLHTWAILPQSMYPLDLRSNTISHLGGDFYGDIGLKGLGSLSYTAWAGLIENDQYGGIKYGSGLTTYDARSEGGDLRWNTPLRGLLGGASYLHGGSKVRGPDPIGIPYRGETKKYEITQFYLQYLIGNLKLNAEYRRTYLDELIYDVFLPPEIVEDSRSIYGSASYRISRHVEIGAYYSRFYLDWKDVHSNPANHIFDKVAAVRVDLTNHWDLKIEGHFINGNGGSDAFRGFYYQDNPQGFKPITNLLVIRTGIRF